MSVAAPLRRSLLLGLLAPALVLAGCGGGDGGGGTGPDRGSLTVTVTGLPVGTAAAVLVTGPENFSRTVTATTTLSNLTAGTYTAAIQEVDGTEARYASSVTSAQATVADGQNSGLTVAYARSTGTLVLTINGLPAGATDAVTVRRGGGFSQTVSASTTFAKLTPGLYEVLGDTVVVGGVTWYPSPAAGTVNITASETPAARTVTYTEAPGQLTVTITGLPPSIPAAVTVTGPGGYAQPVTATTTLTNLAPGSYVVTAAGVTSGVDVFTPAPTAQNVTILSGGSGAAAIAYTSAAGTTLNLDIPQAYLVQAIQRPDGTAGLVAGRDALLRVFVRASETNTAQPDVRVTLFNGATPVSTFDIEAPGASVPATINEGTLGSSWNFVVNANLIQPGLGLLVEVDPTDAIAESAESDNTYPANGTPQALTVTTVPPFEVVFVPIQTGDGLTGDVTPGNADGYLELARRLFPFQTVTGAVRDVLPSSRILGSSGTNWSELLGDLQAVKLAESDPRYWYGVVGTSYSSGVAGIGYVAGSVASSGAKTALGWDKPNSRDDVSAHEWGHNLGRPHAPCGGVAGPDPFWPAGAAYSSGKIGVHGYDQVAGVVRPPTYTDIMGYCNQQWISDYNWENVRTFRGSAPAVQTAQAPAAGLLVWGRVEGGEVILEPAFALTARPTPSSGAWRVEARDGTGRVVASRAFEVLEVADLPGDVRHFTVVMPLEEGLRDRLAELRVSGPAGSAALRRQEPPAGAAVRAEAELRREGAGAVVRWAADRHPAVLVRDPATGRVLGIGRGGELALPTVRGEVEVLMSDGVRTTRSRGSPR